MAGIPSVRSASTTSTSRSGLIATIGLNSALNLDVGDVIFVRGVRPISYNGRHVITAISNTAPYSVSFKSLASGAQTQSGTVYAGHDRTTIATTETSGTGTVATVLLETNPNIGIGESFTISGVLPSAYNGTWTVVDVSEEYPYGVSFNSTATGSQISPGTFRIASRRIFDTGDWGIVGTDLSSLSTRTRENVESALRADVQQSQGWGSASGILFGNGVLDSSLPFPVALVKAVAQSVIRVSVGSIQNIQDALNAIETWFDAFFYDLQHDPGSIIGSAQNIKMDNQRTFSQFLTEAWKAITKEPGTGKTVDDAVAALSALSDKVGEAYFNSTDAQDFQGEVIKAGSNLIKNAGFESKLYEQSVGTFVTEQARTGSKSLRIIGNGTFTSAYTLLSTDSTPRNITVAPGEIFYAEVYVRGNPNNSQTVGGAGGIRMLFQPYSGTNQALTPSVFALAASTDLNNGWEQLAGYITMPPTAKYLTIKLELTPAVELGEKYYFDDVLVREVTLASAANTAATTAGTTADAAKENLQTTVDGIVQSVDGGSSTGAAHMTVKEKLQNAWSNMWDGLSGNNNATATGKRPIDVFLAGKTARNQADLGVTNAGIADGKVETGITGIHQSITGDSSSGSVTTIKARFQSAWSNLWHGLNGDSSVSTSDKTPGHIFTVGKAARDQANLGVTNAGVADGKVETAVTGIHQSITGDSSSGSVTTIKGRLQEAWSNLWDGLSGNSNATATGKRPLDVFLAGKTARLQADLGVTNAGVADGKAAAAKSMLSTKSSLGSNLAVDAGFENTYFNHSLWGGSVITTEQAHSGSRSVKLYGSNTYWNSCDMICDENGKTWIPVSPNDVYYVEFWVLGKTTNNVNAAGNVFLQIDIQNSDGSWNYGGVHASRSNSGTWIKYSGYITAPSNALKMSPTIYLGENTPSSEIYYVDDVVIREVTEGNVAKTNAQTITDGVYQAVEGGSATGNSHATVKDRLQAAWSRMWDGLNGSASASSSGKFPSDLFTVGKAARTQADLGVTNASIADGKAVTADGKAVTAQSNVQSTVDSVYQAVEGGSSTGNPPSSVKDRLQAAWSRLWDGLNGSSSAASTGKLPSDLFTVGKAARTQADLGVTNAGIADGKAVTAQSNAQTITDGVYQAVEGGSATGNAHATVKDRLQAAWSRMWDGLNGSASASATGKTPADIFTVGKAARQQADLGVTNAGVADGKAVTAQADANIGIMKAKFGSNMVYSPDFEDTSVTRQAWSTLGVGNGSYSTEQKYTGTKSYKFTADAYSVTGGNGLGMQWYLDNKTQLASVSPGTTYYMECWIYAHASNATPNSGHYAYLTMYVHDSKNILGDGYVHAEYKLVSAITKGQWNKFSGYVTVPSGYDQAVFYYWQQATAIGDTYYIDNVIVREVTEGFTAKTNAQTITDGVYQAIEGGSSTGNAHTTVKDRLQAAWSRMWDGLNGSASTSATGKTPADIFTVGKAARQQADLGVTNAGAAQGSVDTAVTGIHQSITGDSSSGSPATIKGRFQEAWSNLWHGLNGDGSVTTSNKTPANVFTVGLAARNKANDAFTNAGVADGKAVVADGKAVSAQSDVTNTVTGIHQSITGDSSSGSPATIKTRFQEAWSNLWHGLNGDGSVTTSNKTPGNIFTVGLAARNKANDAFTNAGIADGKATTADGKAVTAQTNAQTITDSVYQSVEGGSSTGNAPGTVKDRLQAAWSRLWDGLNNSSTASSTGKLPSDLFTVGKTARVQADLGVTNAGIADGKAAKASGITSALSKRSSNICTDPGFENTNMAFYADGGITRSTEVKRTGSYSAKFVSNLNWKSVRLTVDGDGQVFPPASPNDTYYTEFWIRGASTNSNTNTGAIYFQIVGYDSAGNQVEAPVSIWAASLTTYKNTWYKVSGYVTLTNANTTQMLPIIGMSNDVPNGDIFYVDDVIMREVTEGFTAKTNAQTITDGVYQAIEGGSSTGNAHATVKDRLQAAWSRIWDGLNGSTSASSSGKVPADVFTVGKAARVQADLGVTNAGLAQSAATTADGKAVVAQSITVEKLKSVGNLASNPGFENTNFFVDTTYYNYSSDSGYVRNGSRSLKMYPNAFGYWGAYMFAGTTSGLFMPCSAGDVYYMEVWVKGASSNVSNSGFVYTNVAVKCGTSSSWTWDYVNFALVSADSVKNNWTKLSGYVTIPANAFEFVATCVVYSPDSSGNIFYWDDVIIREVTEANNAKTNLQVTVDGIYQSVEGGSSTGNAHTTVKDRLQAAWSRVWDGLNGSGSASSSGKLPGDVFTVSAALKTRADNAHGRLDTTNANLFGNTNGGTQIQAAAITPGSIDSGKLASAVNSDISSRLPAATFRTRTRSSQNLIPSPGFEDISFSRCAYNIGFTTSYYSANQKRSGSYSFGWTTQSPTVNQYRGLLACPNDADTYFEVTAGEKYYLEGYFYVPTAAGSSGNVEAGVAYYDTNNTWISGENPAGCILSVSSTVKNDWNKVSGYTTVPAGATRMQVWFLTNTGVLPNVTFYLDDVILREVTESTGIKQNLYGKNTVDSSILTGVLPSGIDGTKITTGSMPQSRVTNLSSDITTTKNLAKGKLSSGANLVSNPGFEYDTFYQSAKLDSLIKRSGSRSAKLVGDGTYYQIYYLFEDESGIVKMPASSGDYFYCEAWCYRAGAAATDGAGDRQVYFQGTVVYADGTEGYGSGTYGTLISSISTNQSSWTKISGYIEVPAAANANNPVVKWYPFLVMGYSTPTGVIVYFDDVVIKEYTPTANLNNTIFGQKTLKSELLSSVLPPNIDGSKIQTGSMPQSRVTNLSNDLTSISGTANTAKSVARTISYAGSNLLKNPGFEDTNFFFNPWWGDTALLNDNATYARSGSRSVKLIGRGTSGQFSGLNVSTDTNGLVVIPATAGDTFYMEFWVKASAAYTNLQYLTFRLVGVNASGGETGEYPPISIRQDQISSTSWTKVSGYVRLSAATTASFYAQLYIDDLTPTTSSFYVDDLIIREVAHSALISNKLYGSGVYAPQNEIIGAALPPNIDGSKIQTGSMSQDRVISLPSDLSARTKNTAFYSFLNGGANLAPNPGFEDTSVILGWQQGANLSYTNSNVHGGNYALKYIGASDTIYHTILGSKDGELTMQSGPGRSYYLEAWVKGDSANPSTATPGAVGMGIWAYNSTGYATGYIESPVIILSGATIGRGSWVKFSGTVTLSNDANIVLARPLMYLSNAVTSAYTFYVDDIIVRDVTEINSVNAQIANALTNTTYAVTGGGFAEALTGLNTTFTNINNAYGKLRALETTKVSATSKGTYTSINFSDYSGDISAAIPAFAVSYPYGSGPSYVAISASTAGWETTSSDRDCKMIYGGTGSTGGSPTATDYQLISGTMFRQPDSGSPTPYFYALARCNAAGTEYVFARMYAISATAFRADVGYKLAGGTEQFLKQGIVLSWDLSMQFEVGTTNGVRTYRIWSKGAVAWDSSWSAANGGVVDSSSAYGQNNRYWGAIAQVRSGKTSGRLTGVSVADNQTPTVNGSTARMARTGGDATLLPANYSANTDVDINAASFFNSAVYQSLDITPDTTSGIFTVTTAGTYAIAARILVTTDTSAWMHVSLVRYTSGAWSLSQRGTSIYANSGGNNALSGEWLQYLAAGDKVKLNIRKSTANGSLITQNASGDTSQSYFSIALLSS